ncbi:MAG: hypothetical protein EOO60_14200, partial [Hymenobacter sp.]
MEDDLFESKIDFAGVNEHNLLRKIWTVPQVTLSFILAKCPDKYLTVLLVLGGAVRALDRVVRQHDANKQVVTNRITIGVILGTLSGWLTYYCYAWGLSLTGSWLGGRATTDQLRTVLAWALVPSVASLALLLPQVAMSEDGSFRREYGAYFVEGSSVIMLCWIGQVVLSTWSVIILLKGIALVQGFGLGKSILNMLLPGTL